MKKIGLILLIIIILPIAFLLFNELGKLNENEKVLEQIYNNQLQAILFSVNQYSEDVVRTTANTIIDKVESYSDKISEDKQFNLLINEGRKFSSLFVTDSLNSNEMRFYFRQNEIRSNIDSVKKYFRSILLQNEALVNDGLAPKFSQEDLVHFHKLLLMQLQMLNLIPMFHRCTLSGILLKGCYQHVIVSHHYLIFQRTLILQ